MKKFVLTVLILTIVITTAAAEEIEWILSYDKALTKAGETNKPIMIDFYTDWCGWCKKLDKNTYIDSAVVAKSSEFVSVKINAEKDRKSAAAHGVSSYPTILFLDKTGKEIWRINGYKTASQFINEMVRAQVQTIPHDLLKEQADLGDMEAAYYLGLKFSGLNDRENAAIYFDKVVREDKENMSGYREAALLDLGLSYLQAQNNDKALENYTLFLGSETLQSYR